MQISVLAIYLENGIASFLKAIDDAVTIEQLNYDKNKLTIYAPADEIVVKLAPAVTAEMEKLPEEEAAEQAAQAPPVEGETSTPETQPETEEKSQ